MNRKKPRGGQPFKRFPSFALPALAGFALLVLAYEVRGFSSVHGLLGDFQAFRCAGSAILHGANPYLSASLYACEHVPAPGGLYAAPSGVVMPAPLPPYALLLFAPAALLDYPVAAALWFGVSAAAVVASALLLARVLRLSMLTVSLMLLLPATVLWLPFGETAPLVLLGSVTAAYGLQARRWILAAVGLSILAVEPHVALGAWICTAIAAPRMRIPLCIAGTVLAGASFAVHPGALFEYVTKVLPIHALAEVPRPVQYSATWLLDALGAAPSVAVRAGAISYAAAVAAGIAIALRLQRRWSDVPVCVFAPIAAAVVGGTFVHASQIALALPFAAALASRESRFAAFSGLACAALAVPWLQNDGQQAVVFLGAAVAAGLLLAFRRSGASALAALSATLLFAMLLVAAHRAHGTSGPYHARAFPASAGAEAYASASWGRYIWDRQSSATIAVWLGKAPTWIALLVLMGAAGAAAANKEAIVSVLVEKAPAAP